MLQSLVLFISILGLLSRCQSCKLILSYLFAAPEYVGHMGKESEKYSRNLPPASKIRDDTCGYEWLVIRKDWYPDESEASDLNDLLEQLLIHNTIL